MLLLPSDDHLPSALSDMRFLLKLNQKNPAGQSTLALSSSHHQVRTSQSNGGADASGAPREKLHLTTNMRTRIDICMHFWNVALASCCDSIAK